MMLGERLAALRKEKGRKQGDMATLLGIARTTYAMYEQGRRDPDTNTLANMARILNVSADYLISGTTLGLQTKAARLEKGLSVKQLAVLTEVSETIIESIENDDHDEMILAPMSLAKLSIALSDDPKSFLLRTSQKWRFRALEFIGQDDQLRHSVDPKDGNTIETEELEFIRNVKEKISGSFFYDFFNSLDRDEWVRSLRLVYKMMREREFELESEADFKNFP